MSDTDSAEPAGEPLHQMAASAHTPEAVWLRVVVIGGLSMQFAHLTWRRLIYLPKEVSVAPCRTSARRMAITASGFSGKSAKAGAALSR
jgi:hypothetical protein